MIDIMVPFEQEGTKAVVRSWLKKVGERVAENDPLVELETDKVTQEVPAPANGVLCEIVLDTDAEAVPGAILGKIGPLEDPTEDGGQAHAVGGDDPPRSASALPSRRDGGASGTSMAVHLSPSVRRAVRQHGIDPSQLAGSGRDGRITRADVDRAVESRSRAPRPQNPAVEAWPPTSDEPNPQTRPTALAGARDVPHDRMRLAIARNMLASVSSAPHVTAVFECDFSAIDAHRRRNKAAFEAQAAKLTFTAYFVAASVEAMRAAPTINSRWHDDRLEVFDDVGVGIGTALGEKGLVVPVVRQAQTLSLLGIARALTGLTERARSGALTPADMSGGTFTISNHGVSGSLLATPIIINQPQSAILGVGKLEKRVVVREVGGADAIQIRPMAYVSLTIDHRVVDGHQTNAWLTRFVEVLEGWPLGE